MPVTKFLAELKRRRVPQVAAAYAAVAFVVAQVADLAAPGLHLPGWTITLVLLLLILGFPLAIVLAWVFDIGPQGIERTGEREAPPPSSPAHAPFAAAPPPAPAAALRRAMPLPDGPSVAVLPFVNLSSDPEQEYFSDGLTEELLNVLVQVPGLRVPARTSSFAFKGQNTDIREIGDTLGVRSVLEGSVRTWERRVLITAQLINVEDGYNLWSDTFKRDLEDIFQVQEEIARSIVQKLKGRLLGEDETPEVPEATRDPEAYRLFLKGRHFHNQFSTDGYRKALALFGQATERDPTFARAWAATADTWAMLAYLGGIPGRDALPQARDAAARAVALDPALADGYRARALLAYHARDFAAAERDVARALELNPGSARAHNSNGNILNTLCRPEEAIERFQRAAELDPLWAAPPNNQANALVQLGRYAEALGAYEQALELNPGNSSLLRNIAKILSDLGRHEEAIARAREVHARQPDSWSNARLAGLLFEDGERAEAEALLEGLERLRRDGQARDIDLVRLYALTRRHDEAFQVLQEAVAADEPIAAQIASDSEWDPLREDPRWEPLLAHAGFPADVIRRSRELYERREAARV